MTRLILIRHGETDDNLQKRYCGCEDRPLNHTGILQAKMLAKKLRDIKVDKVYSSDLQRTYKTAEIIFGNDAAERSADFREMNFGIFEGLSYSDIMADTPDIYRKWISDPVKITIPKGESLMELNKRVMGKLLSVISSHKDKTLALITHSGPIRIILCQALRYNLDMFWKINQDNGAVNIIDYAEDLSARVLKINGSNYEKIYFGHRGRT